VNPDKHARHTAAGIAWTLAFLYLLVELVTATAWKTDYSFRYDSIVVHSLAVMPALVFRHIVVILLAVWLWKQRRLAAMWSAFCASTGPTGTVLLTIGLQVGITERIVFYPLPTWMAVTGAAIMLTPLRRSVRPSNRRRRGRLTIGADQTTLVKG
jgi:hypothetical protein